MLSSTVLRLLAPNHEKIIFIFYGSMACGFRQTQNASYCLHPHIISHYNPSVRNIDLVSHTIYVVYVNFIHKRRDLQSKVDSERQIFFSFHGNFNLLSEFLPEICWEEIGEEILFVFCFDVWPGIRTRALRLIS